MTDIATTAAAETAPPADAVPPQNTPPVDVLAWTAEFPDEDKAFISTKGYQTPADLAKAARSASSLIGEYGNLPKELRDTLRTGGAEAARAEALRLLDRAAPEKPEAYTNALGDAVKAEDFAPFAKAAHELGLSDAQFKGLQAAALAAAGAQAQATGEQTLAAVKDWMGQDQARAAQVQIALAQAQVGEADIVSALSEGPAGLMSLIGKLAARVSEAPVIAPSDLAAGPATAAARAAALRADPAWLARYHSSDRRISQAASNELTALNRLAHGG